MAVQGQVAGAPASPHPACLHPARTQPAAALPSLHTASPLTCFPFANVCESAFLMPLCTSLLCRLWIASQDFDETFDTWEHANLTTEMIEEYENEQIALAKLCMKLQKPPKKPFSLALAEAESDEARALRIEDAKTTLEFLQAEAGERTQRVKKALAEVKVCVIKPMTAVAFHGLRDRLARMALLAQVRSPPCPCILHPYPYTHAHEPARSRSGLFDCSVISLQCT